MSKIRILLNGAFGKMGRVTAQTLATAENFQLVGELGKQDNLGAFIEKSKAQIVIDFTTAAAAFENTKTIIAANARPVIGTSGLSPDQIAELTQLCADKKLGGIIAPNFCIGALLMMQYAQNCARYFPHVEIIEMHHDEKADAPSGTAVKTAQLLNVHKANTAAKIIEKETIKGARGAIVGDIHIHSVRLPGLVAHQEVIFGSVGELITLRHDMFDRQAAMRGVLLACQKVMELQTLTYGLEHFL